MPTDSSSGTSLKFEPSLLLSLIGAVALGITEVISKASESGEFNLWSAVKIALPIVVGFAIRQNVVSRAWLHEKIAQADSAIEAVRPVANEVSAPIPPATAGPRVP